MGFWNIKTWHLSFLKVIFVDFSKFSLLLILAYQSCPVELAFALHTVDQSKHPLSMSFQVLISGPHTLNFGLLESQ